MPLPWKIVLAKQHVSVGRRLLLVYRMGGRSDPRQHLPAPRHSSQAIGKNKWLVFLNKSFFFLDMDRLLKNLGLINFLILEADIVILLIPLLSSSSLLSPVACHGAALQWPPARHCTMDTEGKCQEEKMIKLDDVC